MSALVLFYKAGTVLLAVCGTATIAIFAPRMALRVLALATGLLSVVLAGWTLLSIIQTGGASTGYQLPFAVFTFGGAVIGAIVWQTISNLADRSADEVQSDISPEVKEKVAGLRDSRIPHIPEV